MESTSSTSENDSQNTFTIIPSQRGGKLLLYDGYRYNFKRKNQNGHTVWICSVKNTCSASLVMNDSVIVKQTEHLCKPDVATNEIKYRLSKCIERAKNETTSVPAIYADTLEEMKD